MRVRTSISPLSCSRVSLLSRGWKRRRTGWRKGQYWTKRTTEADFCKQYTFRNSEGHEFKLRGDLTIEDLIKMGFSDFRLVEQGAPFVTPNEWRSDPAPPSHTNNTRGIAS